MKPLCIKEQLIIDRARSFIPVADHPNLEAHQRVRAALCVQQPVCETNGNSTGTRYN